MKKRIPDEIIYYSLDKILDYMKIHNIGLNDPVKITNKYYNNSFPSILHVFVSNIYTYNEKNIKEIIKLGANVNIVNRSFNKKSIFEYLIDFKNFKLLNYCLPYFKLKSNYSLMKCVYDNIKYSTKIDRKAKLLNRLSSMFRQDKWERVKYSLDNDPYKGAKTLEEYDDIFFRRNWTCGKCTTIEEGENCPNCAFNNPDYEYPFD